MMGRKTQCKGLLMESECKIHVALEGFQKNKSPGTDGVHVTAEFYSFFWNEQSKTIMIESFNCGFITDELLISQL